jgi:nitrate/nitrite-specific signal transduction histidine kinase
MSTSASESGSQPDSRSADVSESIHARFEQAEAATPTPDRTTSTRATDRWAYKWVDRRLKVMSVLLPVVFIVGLDYVLYTIHNRNGQLEGFRDGYRLVFIGVTVVAIVVFGLVMFRFIDRAQQQVVRQNRELAATNALSNAVQGEVGVDRIIDVALESVLNTSGATQASVTIFTTDDRSPQGPGVTRRQLARAAVDDVVPDDPDCDDEPTIDLALSTGTVHVGRMRLWLPLDKRASDRLASGTLQNIGHQLASAIQLAQLVADLQRRKYEGHAFYDVLLQISNQKPPPEILSAVVRHARNMMSSDEAVLSLTEGAFRSVQFSGPLEGTAFADGTACITTDNAHGCQGGQGGQRHQAHGPDTLCPVQSSPDWVAHMAVPIVGPIETLGQLWIGRRSSTLFTERDRGFLVTLSGLAAIAITSVQMRENGRQHAVLAERGRIAREMHDSLAQVLGVTHLRLRAMDAHADVQDSPEIAAELDQIADICQEAYRDVRESILGLRGSKTTELGLLDNLRAYLAKYSQQCDIAGSLNTDLSELALSPRCEVQVIRVIQEALTNVRKHSGATTAVVHVTESDCATTFVVEDNGQGFAQDHSAGDRDGFGMYTMRERMALLNGSLTIDSEPGRGTRVIAEVPERSRARPVP